MKKFLSTIFFLFVLLSFSYAEETKEFTLFPKTTSIQDITSKVFKDGWKVSFIQSGKAMVLEPTEEIFYYGKIIHSITCMFDAEGYINYQNIAFGNRLSSSEAFATMMEIACIDKASFYKSAYKIGDYGSETFAYYATTKDYDNCLYSVSGVDDIYFISIVYSNN